MERRELSRGRFRTLAAMAAAAALWAAAPPLVTAQTAADADSYVVYDGKKVAFPVAQDIVALDYGNVDAKSAKALGAADAKALGLEVIEGVRRAANQVYVKASPEQAKSLVASKRSSLSADVAVKPVFYYNGVPSLKYMVVVPDTLVVAFQDDPGLKGVAEFAERYGLGESKEIMSGVFRFAAGKTPTEGIPALTARIAQENAGVVRYSEPSYITHLELHSSTAISTGNQGDPLFFRQWHQENTSRNRIPRGLQDKDSDAPRAWNWNLRATIDSGDGRTRGYFGNPKMAADPEKPDNPATGADFIAVAVFDTGIDLDHPEWKINATDPDNGPNPGTTIIHPQIGVDAIDGDLIPDADNEDPHGTAVAGVIAGARNNGTGGAGIAPLARIYSVRIFDSQSVVPLDGIAEEVNNIRFEQVDLANHSWGGPVPSSALNEAFKNAFESGRNDQGMLNFASSANDTTGMGYPALYDYTISVGGVDDTGQHVDYASYGGKLDFVGFTQQSGRAGILTTDFTGGPGYAKPDATNPENPSGDYTYDFNGTSAACPVVVGIAALVLAEEPELRAIELFERLAQTADRYPNEYEYIPRGAFAAHMATFAAPEPPPPPEEGRAAAPRGVGDPPRTLGSPDGFRRFGGDAGIADLRIDADGFSPYFGYGQPNPYKAIAGVRATSPLRDYEAPVASTDPRGLLGDYGELEMVWASDLGTDMFAQIEACRLLLAGDEGDPAEVDPADILECINTGAVDVSEVTPWAFRAPRSFDGTDRELGPIEMGFLPYPNGAHSGNFEFGRNASIDGIGEGEVPCVIATTIPTGALSVLRDDDGILLPLIEAGDGDQWYNPRGRYLSYPLYYADSSFPRDGGNGTLQFFDPNGRNGYTYELELDPAAIEASIQPYVGQNAPMIIEFSMKHELGVYDLISTVSVGNDPAGFESFDAIYLTVNGQQIGLPIRGDTANQPLPGAVLPDEDTVNIDIGGVDVPVADWSYLLPFRFIPDTGRQTLTFRTYRYVVPASVVDSIVPYNSETGTGGMQISFSLTPGVGYIPEYNEDLDDQVPEVRRHMMGFHLADLKIWAVDQDADPNTGLTGKDIVDPAEVLVSNEGRMPVWSPVENELFFIGKDATVTTEPGASVAGTVRTAVADGGTRVFGGELDDFAFGGSEPPIKVARESQQLLTALAPGSAAAPNHTPTRILSIDASRRRSQLLYVKDGGNFQPAIWLTSDDGYGEQPLFPLQPGEIAKDLGTVSAKFAAQTDAVFYTNGDVINVADIEDGVSRFVVDSANLKRTRFNDLSATPDDIFVVFSAETSAGDRGLYYVPQNLHDPNIPTALSPGQYTLVDWPNSAERDCSVSVNGQHVAFSSNTIDRTGGTVPPANAPYKIYVIGNLADLLTFGAGAAPDVVEVDMRRGTAYVPSPSPVDQYSAGRWPRFSPSQPDVLAFTAYLNPGPELGEIALLEVDLPSPAEPTIPDVYDPPTVDPLPAAAAPPDDQIGLAGTSTFDVSGDGWTFTNDAPGFVSPAHSTADRSLRLVSSNNNANTYGYFRSPGKFLVPFPVQLADRIAEQEKALGRAMSATERAEFINNLKLPLYLLRYYVRRTTPDALAAPTLRLRLNSRDFQDYGMATIPSTSGRGIPPTDTAVPIDMLFEPNPHLYDLQRADQGYTLSFDLLNIYPDDDPNGGYILDRVDVFRLDPDAVETVGLIRSYTFSTQAQINEWQRYQREDNLPFDLPTYTSGNGRLSMAVANPASTFGYWYTGIFPNTTDIEGHLFLKCTGTIEAEDTSALRVPDMRFKLSRMDYSMTVEHATIGTSVAKLSPSAGQPRVLRTYLPVDADAPTTPYIATWDAMSFENFSSQPDLLPTQTSNLPVNLDAARFDLVRVRNYPEPIENP